MGRRLYLPRQPNSTRSIRTTQIKFQIEVSTQIGLLPHTRPPNPGSCFSFAWTGLARPFYGS